MPIPWSKLSGRGRAQASGKCPRRECFEKSSSEKLTPKHRGKFHKKNRQSQFCKSKNETESLWINFTYSKTEIRDTFIFGTEARIYFLLLSCSHLFPGFIWAASMLLWLTWRTWFMNAHPLLWSVPFISALMIVLVCCCSCNNLPQTWWLKTTDLLFYSLRSQESDVGLAQLKSKCQQGCTPFRVLSGRTSVLAFSSI